MLEVIKKFKLSQQDWYINKAYILRQNDMICIRQNDSVIDSIVIQLYFDYYLKLESQSEITYCAYVVCMVSAISGIIFIPNLLQWEWTP